MDDLISRAAAIKICKSNVPNTNPDFFNMKSKSGYGSWMHSNGEAVAITRIEVGIEALPTIDAIPVEWLNDRIYDMKRAPLYRRYAEMLLMEWLQEQKEQEA